MKNVFKYLFLVLIVASCKDEVQNHHLIGNVFGTTYSIQFEAPASKVDFQEQFDKLFYIINKSMSTYQENSIISKINRNEEITYITVINQNSLSSITAQTSLVTLENYTCKQTAKD